MPGGSREAYAIVEPILTSIAAKVDGVPCCTYVGPDGAGHYVKMVHNGIEYADMQLIAEAYDLLRQGLGMSARAGRHLRALELRRPGPVPDRDHRQGAAPHRRRDRQAAGRPDRGQSRAEGHRALDRPARPRAGRADHRDHRGGVRPRGVLAQGAAGGRQQDPDRPHGKYEGAADALVEDVRQALYASKVVAYAQGFDQIKAAADTYDWGIDLGAMATIWRGGCIIRARASSTASARRTPTTPAW